MLDTKIKLKVLLLNPPSSLFLMRDYFCSHTSKAKYCWAPVDLVVLSGYLSEEFQVEVIDSIVSQLDEAQANKYIKDYSPDVVISLISAIDLQREIAFLDSIKEAMPNTKMLVVGDVAHFNLEIIKKLFPRCDAVLREFIIPELAMFLKGKMEGLKNMSIHIEDGNWIDYPLSIEKNYKIPVPSHNLFCRNYYRMPYSRYSPVATVLTAYGCPYRCTFCNSGQLDFRNRDLSNLAQELSLIAELGYKEIYFRDFSFSVNKKRTLEICNELNKWRFIWSCDARVDNLDHELLDAMKKSGCFLILIGVEVGDNEGLVRSNKSLTIEKIKDIVNYCYKIGIKTLGTFIIGLPFDTNKSIERTISFSQELPLTYASFNMYVPRFGSLLRKDIIKDDIDINDESLDVSVFEKSYCELSSKELKKYYNKAIMGFYLRPKYLIERITEIKSLEELRIIIENGTAVVSRLIKNKISNSNTKIKCHRK